MRSELTVSTPLPRVAFLHAWRFRGSFFPHHRLAREPQRDVHWGMSRPYKMVSPWGSEFVGAWHQLARARDHVVEERLAIIRTPGRTLIRICGSEENQNPGNQGGAIHE